MLYLAIWLGCEVNIRKRFSNQVLEVRNKIRLTSLEETVRNGWQCMWIPQLTT